MKKFVMVDSHTLKGTDFSPELNLLSENGIECVLAECKTDEEIINAVKDADAIGLNYSHITKDIILKMQNCKAIIRYGIGFDTVDVEAATERGIAVCNLPDYCVDEVATHAMALILDTCRKTTFFDKSVRAGLWDSNYGYKMHRLSALTLGLIGFGNTARLLSHYAKSFDMNIISYDPYAPDNLFEQYGVTSVSLEKLYKESDIISIHVPLTDETKHLINKDTIEKMKDGVIIINTSRGPIISIDDLLEALKNKKVCAAGLDVVEIEPIKDPNCRIYNYENLVVTPHAAYNSVEASNNQHMKVAKTAVQVLNGEMPYNVVNIKKLSK
ncbi:MAG: C-terminal binding protein [Sedimentibacter sp.]|uniref:C-terminal binding protein n=1 Tax=Sedimentibacter sp. TaxID=1960295 RepID=UPI00315901A6